MAFKFQVGPAILSGSLKLEEALDAAGGIKLSGVADTALDVANDSFLFRDDDGTMKRDSMVDYAVAIAGDGLAASGGALSVGVDDASIETSGDALRVKALGVTNAMLAGSIADSKLNQITTGDKVAGSAVQLAGTSALEDSTGLQLKAATAGDGLAMNSQVLSVDLNELTAAAVNVGADSIAIIDADDSNGSKKESIADLMTAVAGSGLKSENGVLEVRVSGSIVRDSDKLGISGSIAGAGLSFAGGANSISSLAVGEITNGGITALPDGVKLDLAGLAAAAVDVANDSIAILDAGDSSSKKESVADFVSAIASTAAGMQASSGQLGVNAGKGLAVSSQKLVLDISGLDAGTIDVASDTFAFDDSGTSKKLTIADLMTAVAGDGLTADAGVLEVEVAELGAVTAIASGDTFAMAQESETGDPTKKITFDDMATKLAGQGLTANAGVLNFRQDVGLKADGGSLVPGVNYFADASSDATVTLPAAPVVGDTVTVKAGNLTSGAKIIINRQGGHVIDEDLTSIEIESPFGAVTCVYVVDNEWRLI